MATGKFLSIALPILASAAYVVELSFVPLILPNLRSDLGLNISALALIFNAYATAVAVAVLIGGWMGDTFGAKRVFVLGVFLFVVGSFAVAMSTQQMSLVLGRVVQGIGGGLFSPLIPVLLAKAAAPRPGRLLILWGSMSGFIAGLAPLVAHQLLGSFGWPLVFTGLAFLAMPALLLVLTKPEIETEHVKPRGTLRASLLQPTSVWALYAYVFCNFGTIMLFLFRLPVTLQDAGYLASQQAWILAVFWVVFAGTGVFLRNIVDTRAIWPILFASPLFISCGFSIFLMPVTPAWACVSSALVGIGFACGNATSTTLVLRFCREGTKAMAASFDISLARLGAVAVVFFAAPLAPQAMVWTVVVLCLLTALFGLLPSPLLEKRAMQR